MMNTVIKQLNYGNIIKDLGVEEFMGAVKKEQEIDGHIKNKEENVCCVAKNHYFCKRELISLWGYKIKLWR